MPQKFSTSLDTGLLRYSRCTVTSPRISGINWPIGEFGPFFDLTKPTLLLTQSSRPLPDEMLKYARADTHFLLHVYDNLRNALLDRAVSRSASPTTSRANSPIAPDAFVREVLSRSEETALRVYSLEFYDVAGGAGTNGWDTLARRWNKPTLGIEGIPSVQREVFLAVHLWRDRVARKEDESTG